MSDSVILPSGPVPLISLILILCFFASPLTKGVARILLLPDDEEDSWPCWEGEGRRVVEV